MFFYKMKDGRTINLDHIVMITPLGLSDNVRIVFTEGITVVMSLDEYHDLGRLIDSYTWHEELK